MPDLVMWALVGTPFTKKVVVLSKTCPVSKSAQHRTSSPLDFTEWGWKGSTNDTTARSLIQQLYGVAAPGRDVSESDPTARPGFLSIIVADDGDLHAPSASQSSNRTVSRSVSTC